MNLDTIGKLIVLIGAILLLVGGSILLMSKYNLSFGQYFQGIRIEIGNMRCSFFLLGSILASLILTIVLNVIVRLLNK